MKVGDCFDCPHCGQSSFLKKESVMNGWKKVGEVLKCASCSAEIGKIENPTLPPRKEETASNRVLLNLLGEEEVRKPYTDLLKEEKRFCRDCVHLVKNAFRMHCVKLGRDRNPMDDCPDFQKREDSERKE